MAGRHATLRSLDAEAVVASASRAGNPHDCCGQATKRGRHAATASSDAEPGALSLVFKELAVIRARLPLAQIVIDTFSA